MWYGIIGFDMEVTNSGNTYWASMDVQNSTSAIVENKVGGYTYSLWRYSLDKVIEKFKYHNPGVDFSFFTDRSKTTQIKFHSLVTTYTSSGANGGVDSNGQGRWGTLYTRHTPYNQWPRWISRAEIDALYNIPCTIPKHLKPDNGKPPASYGQVLYYDYNVPGSADYWVRVGNEFTIYGESSLLASIGAPDWNYSSLDGYGKRNTAWVGKDGSQGVQNQYNENFRNFSSRASTKVQNNANYLFTHFRSTAKHDNQDYAVNHYSQYGSHISSSAWSGQYIKTDGTAPGSNYSPAHRMNNINEMYLLQQNVTDYRSGLNNGSVHAYVYPRGHGSGSPIYLHKSSTYADFYNTINLQSHVGNNYGDIMVDVYATDNVGNQGLISSTSVYRPYPTPTSEFVIIEDYEYETHDTKWVRAGNEFKVRQRGYSNSIYPTGSHITIEDQIHTTMNVGDIWTGQYTGHIWRNRDNRLDRWQGGSNLYGEGSHFLVANSELNGRKFRVRGLTETWVDGNHYTGDWRQDDKLLGIDSKAPDVIWEKTGRDEVTITVTDNESGVNTVVIDKNSGNDETKGGGSFIIDLQGSTSTTITSKDNVGNESTITIGDIKTVVSASITTEEVSKDGEKQLKVTTNATVTNPVPGKVMKFQVLGNGDGVPLFKYPNIVHEQDGSLSHVFYVRDIYNQPHGPGLGYHTSDVNSEVKIDELADILKSYGFSIASRVEGKETSWTTEVSKNVKFASQYKHFKYSLFRLTDEEFNPILEKRLVDNEVNTSRSVSMNNYVTGKYRIEVIMYDHNNNPSGKSVLVFDHEQPFVFLDLDLDVTAVKDLQWETENYPIQFHADKFPLGEKYKFNGKDIKLGYNVNYNVEIPSRHSVTGYKTTYKLTDISGNELSLYSNGSKLQDLDRTTGSNYLSQTSNFSTDNGRLYLKHHLPANAEIKNSSGQNYTGPVRVKARVIMYKGVNENVTELDLYTVITSSTALDDLTLDKQR